MAPTRHAPPCAVTLLLCNAAAMETLPLALDRLMPAYLAIIVSVTAVLFFGEYVLNVIGAVIGSV